MDPAGPGDASGAFPGHEQPRQSDPITQRKAEKTKKFFTAVFKRIRVPKHVRRLAPRPAVNEEEHAEEILQGTEEEANEDEIQDGGDEDNHQDEAFSERAKEPLSESQVSRVVQEVMEEEFNNVFKEEQDASVETQKAEKKPQRGHDRNADRSAQPKDPGPAFNRPAGITSEFARFPAEVTLKTLEALARMPEFVHLQYDASSRMIQYPNLERIGGAISACLFFRQCLEKLVTHSAYIGTQHKAAVQVIMAAVRNDDPDHLESYLGNLNFDFERYGYPEPMAVHLRESLGYSRMGLSMFEVPPPTNDREKRALRLRPDVELFFFDGFLDSRI